MSADLPLTAAEKKALFSAKRRLTVDDIVDFPAFFTVINENQWGNVPRMYETLEGVTVCDGTHPGLCDDEHCVGFECMIECIQHRHGYDCKGMNFRRSVGAALGLYKVGTEYGVFAINGAEKHEFMCEYMGNVVWDTDIEKDNAYYVMLDGELLLDGSKCGGIARFINHLCSPNCLLQVWWVPVGTKYEPRVGIFALRHIDKGEPLTFTYHMVSIVTNTILCYCGSKQCKTYLNTECKRRPFCRITRHKTNAVRAATNLASTSRTQAFERLHAVGPNGEYDVHFPTLCANVQLFEGLTVDGDNVDYVSMVNAAFQKHDRKPNTEIVTHGALVDPKTQEVSLTVTVCGVPFTSVSKNARLCKQMCFRTAIRVFQSIKITNVPGVQGKKSNVIPRSVVVREIATDAPPKDIKAVVQAMWTIAMQYRTAMELAYQTYVETEGMTAIEREEQQAKKATELTMLQKIMLMSANELFPVPQHFMKHLGVLTFKIHDVVDSAAVLLSTRMKKAEIGSPARMKCVYHDILPVKNATYGTHLLLLGALVDEISVDDLLETLEVTLQDVVDEETFVIQTGEPLTSQTFHTRMMTANQRALRSRVYGARIRSVVWPMQTIGEFYEALGLLETQLNKQISKDCVRRMKAQIQGESVLRTLGVHMNVEAKGENFSSMVIATQMNLTEAQYTAQVEQCHRYREQLRTTGFAWMSLDPEDCNNIRVIVKRWIQIINDELLIAPNTRGHRNIGSWVDEYALYPGGTGAARNAALKKFLKALCGVAFADVDAVRKMSEKPIKGLSPIALTEAGACFREMELLLVLSAELRTNNHSLTVAAHTALGAHFGTSRQPPHLDDQRHATLIAGLPMNLPNEGPFQATLVPKMPLDFEKLYSDKTIPKDSDTFSETFLETYKPLIDKTPDEFLASMQPAVETFENSGMLVTMGNQLHCGPGNTVPGASSIRLVTFAATGMEGSHYDGKQQLMWDQMIEQMYGAFSFWSLLHIVEFSLCEGIHVWEHYGSVSLPISMTQWTRSRFPIWTRTQFLESLIAQVRYLCSPWKLELCEWPLCGQPTRSRKRTLVEGECKYDFGTAKYSRLQVRRAMAIMWRYLTVRDDRAKGVIRSFFSSIQFHVPVSSWQPWKEFKVLRGVYQLMYPSGEDQEGAAESFGYETIREASKKAIVGIPWSVMTEEMERTVGQVINAADRKVAQAQREGFVQNSFVVFKHEGVEKRGIITGYNHLGNIEVSVPYPVSIDIVVEKKQLRVVNP